MNRLRKSTHIFCKLSSCVSPSFESIQFLHTTSSNRWQDFENERHYDAYEDFFKRIKHGLTYDFRRWKRRYNQAKYDVYERRGIISHMKREVMRYELLPYHCDFLILGGGIVGSSIAWWLKQRLRDEDMNVVVVENNEIFTRSSTILAAGGIQQQFSIPENVEMSLFAAEFLRNTGEHLRILDSDPPDIHFLPMGYLFLTSTNDGAETMRKNWQSQIQLGAKVDLIERENLRLRFPFINFDDIVLGSFGLENEGSIDSWQLLSALREKNMTLGVQYLKGEVEGFMFDSVNTKHDVHGFVADELVDDVNYRLKRMTGVYV